MAAGDVPLLDQIGRWIFFGYFLLMGLCNLTRYQIRAHVDRMRELGVPGAHVAFWIGLVIQFSGCALLLTERYAAIGVACLVFFVIAATLIFHRFWNYSDAPRRNSGRINLCNNVAIVSGLLLLAQNVK